MKRILLVIWVFLKVKGDSRVNPSVDTKVGLIRGLNAVDGDYFMFMGIPYGEIDDKNPFGPSAPYPPFSEAFDAFDDSVLCPQRKEDGIVGSLDCLNLNIYVPSSANFGSRFPVLVWIHGEGFTYASTGKNDYSPKNLVKQGIILVTINYRLGPYGFLCLGTRAIPGNQGLKDQLLALRWIKNNIESFGGETSKITLFGESSGAMSVDAHLHSVSEKIFDKIILHSGTILTPSLPREINLTVPVQLAYLLGFDVTDPFQAITFLNNVDPNQVIEASLQMDLHNFWPCVERDYDNAEEFLVDYPINLNIPKATNTSFLIGFNAEESIYVHAYLNNNHYYGSWNGINDQLVSSFKFDEDQLVEMEEIIKRFYIGDESFSSGVWHKLAEFDTDFQFVYPIERSIERYIDNDAGNIFSFIFSYVGDRTLYNIGYAGHADELGYLFDVPAWDGVQPSAADQLIMDRMTTMWANFVKYGDPTPKKTELLPIKWEPITTKNVHNYLNINTEMKLEKRPYHKRIAFWDLFYKINEEFQIGYKPKHSAKKTYLQTLSFEP